MQVLYLNAGTYRTEQAHIILARNMQVAYGMPVAVELAQIGFLLKSDGCEGLTEVLHVKVNIQGGTGTGFSAVYNLGKLAEVGRRVDLIYSVYLLQSTVVQHLVHPCHAVTDKVAYAVHLGLPGTGDLGVE